MSENKNTKMPQSENQQPLVTFALLAYNQEDYIREAIEGAFSQTYSPLEIILSDDCSSDRTFGIMQEMANKYDGVHRIILNCNSNNLGLGDHVNRIMDLSNGEWIVGAAGDDISYPHRTSETIECAMLNPDAHSIYGDLDYIRDDPSNQTKYHPDISTHALSAMIRMGGAKVAGPTHAWRRDTFELFGPLPGYVVSEDRAIPFRSALLGDIVWVPKKWTRYRIHYSSISSTGRYATELAAYNQVRLAPFHRMVASFQSFARDLDTALEKNIVTSQQYAELSNAIRVESTQVSRYIQAWNAPYFRRIVCAAQILFSPSSYTGDSNLHRLSILLNAICPFIDPVYHRLVRIRRFPQKKQC